MNNIDKNNIRRIIKDSPKQFLDGLLVAKDIKISGRFDNVIICGMGGSAFPADLVREYLTEPISVIVCRDYHLPRETTKKSLIIVSSYSGNTEETLATMREAIKRRLTIVALTRGGKIKSLCEKNHLPCAIYPDYGQNFQSRMAASLAFSTILTVLANAKLIKNHSPEIKKLSLFLSNLSHESQGKALAKKLIGKIPIIYTPGGFKATGYAWKIRLNENADVMAFNYYFPELNHNEMDGFSQMRKIPNDFHFLFLRPGGCTDKKTAKRMDLTKTIIEKQGKKVTFVDTAGHTKLEKMWSNLNLSNWTAYWLAIFYKLDPADTESIRNFKLALHNK